MSSLTGERLRFESLSVGDEVVPLSRGPLRPPHLMRWSAAIENWHRIHYDLPFAVEHDSLPGLLVNGSWKQHFLVQMLRNWVGHGGWVVAIAFEFRKMNVVGESLTAWGTVTSVQELEGIGLVRCDIGIRNESGIESTPGTATIALPLDDGELISYPFSGLREHR
jgi:acyl dehydratase